MDWSNRQPRKKNTWTAWESMVVIRIMKKKLAYAKTLILCKNEGLNRSLKEVKQHYQNLRAKYLVIRRWEAQASGEDSYFDMSLSERRRRALPLRFNREFYDLMSKRIPSSHKAHEDEKAPSGTIMANSLLSLTDEVLAELEVESTMTPKADSDSEVETTMDECPVIQEADIGSEIGTGTMKEEDRTADLVSEASTGTMKEEDPMADLVREVDSRIMKEEEGPMVREADSENEVGSAAVQETDKEEEDPAITCTIRWSQEEDQVDKIAFADGCLHFDDDNVADGYLKAAVEEKPKEESGSGQVRLLPKEEVELVEERTKEALRASESYEKAVKFWRPQKVQMDQHRMELLMKADASFVLAINQLAFAVRRLADRLY